MSFFRPTMAQTESISCGTDARHQARMQTDSAYRNFVARIKQQIAETPPDKSFDGTTYTIPVVFVVYHLGEPVGTGSNLSDATLQAQVNLMNQIFAGNSTTYPGATANIQFTLAQRTPDCQPFNGIVRIDGRVVPNYQTTGADAGPIDNQLRQLAGPYANPLADNVVVIRVVHTISPAGLLGYAFFGGDMFVTASGINTVSTYNKVLSHEMGHVLFLHHTFQGSTSTASGYTCPPNTNPATDGDEVADTDPHKPFEPANCYAQTTPESITSTNTCTGQPFGWIANNIMAYGCYANRFTQGQVDRMRAFLATNNRTLGLSSFTTPPAPNAGITTASCSVSYINAPSAGYATGISRFQFSSIDRSSGNVPFFYGHYQNYTCSDRAVVSAGSTYSFTITANTFPSTTAHRRIYIDYNNDGAFNETTELAFASNNGTGIGTLTIPPTAVLDTYLRMRVIADNASVSPTSCWLAGITGYGYGEAEDYAILVPTPVCPTATVSGSQTITTGQSVLLSVTLTGTSPWSLTLSDGQSFSNITTSPFSISVSPANSTTYTLSRVTNVCGTGTASGSAMVTVIPVNCSAPNIFLSPVTTPNSATVGWGGIAGVLGYGIRTRLVGWPNWGNVLTTTSTRFVSSGWVMGSTVEYQVQALCPSGPNSAFSASQFFTTICLSPSATISGSGSINAGGVASLTVNLAGGDPLLFNPVYSFTLSNGLTFSNVGSLYSLTVSPGVSTTYTVTRVSNGCNTAVGTGLAVVTVIQSCTAMTTVRAGNWNDPGTWSCNRVPVSTDEVQVGHLITVPAGISSARLVRYVSGGRLQYSAGGRLQLTVP